MCQMLINNDNICCYQVDLTTTVMTDISHFLAEKNQIQVDQLLVQSYNLLK